MRLLRWLRGEREPDLGSIGRARARWAAIREEMERQPIESGGGMPGPADDGEGVRTIYWRERAWRDE